MALCELHLAVPVPHLRTGTPALYSCWVLSHFFSSLYFCSVAVGPFPATSILGGQWWRARALTRALLSLGVLFNQRPLRSATSSGLWGYLRPLLFFQSTAAATQMPHYVCRSFESSRCCHLISDASSFLRPDGGLRRVFLFLPGTVRSLSFSAASLQLITSSQKEVTAALFSPPAKSAFTSAAGDRFGPIAALKFAALCIKGLKFLERVLSGVGVCSAVMTGGRCFGAYSLQILPEASVSGEYLVRYVSTVGPDSAHCSQLGRVAPPILLRFKSPSSMVGDIVTTKKLHA